VDGESRKKEIVGGRVPREDILGVEGKSGQDTMGFREGKTYTDSEKEDSTKNSEENRDFHYGDCRDWRWKVKKEVWGVIHECNGDQQGHITEIEKSCFENEGWRE
jgi:hypothetical protein